MKKIFTFLMIAMVGFALTGCRQRIWEELDELDNRVTALEEIVKKTNSDIAAIQTILNAIQNNVFVTNVITTPDGYTIQFSDGTSATISNGTDGADANAPVISVKQDTDGNYYWTINGEWLIVDGERVRANGHDGQSGQDGQDGQNGQDGQDAVAPQVRINEDTKEWEISTDGGVTWVSTGVIAEGQDGENGSVIVEGETLFQSIDYTNEDYVIFTLADGTVLKVARYDESAPMFIIVDAPELIQMEYGATVEFEVEATNVVEHLINVPEGWHASYINNVLSITAPAKDLCHYDKEGFIAITVVSDSGKMSIVKKNVMAGEWVASVELRTLTFEDANAQFTPYELEYFNNKQITTWSDLIAEDQYGDYILGYGTWMGECIPTDDSHYSWYDENNTFLAHDFPLNYDSYCFAGGGHAISNYVSSNYAEHGNYMYQLTAYDKDANGLVTSGGGHNGSDNFAVHYGYYDGSSWNQTTEEDLPAIYFKDGEARVIDHLYVCLTTYEYYCLYEGNGLTAPMGEGDYVILEAIGHKEDGTTNKISIRVADYHDGVIDDWTKWDLTALGEVVKVNFNIIGTNDNGYGFSQPAYFAYDDVAVQFPGETIFR
ncbi:MAG: DUF4465 domain-containing protein [Bacteroidales bacterium]|nr:DUF4465 domain-containing protein [Bacteroidales bacterium]